MTNRQPDINFLFTIVIATILFGYTNVNDFFFLLGHPGLNRTTYYKWLVKLQNVVDNFWQKQKEKNIEKEIIMTIEKKSVIKKNTMGKPFLTLSYDGTWVTWILCSCCCWNIHWFIFWSSTTMFDKN
jgi:hypothetical protein